MAGFVKTVTFTGVSVVASDAASLQLAVTATYSTAFGVVGDGGARWAWNADGGGSLLGYQFVPFTAGAGLERIAAVDDELVGLSSELSSRAVAFGAEVAGDGSTASSVVTVVEEAATVTGSASSLGDRIGNPTGNFYVQAAIVSRINLGTGTVTFGVSNTFSIAGGGSASFTQAASDAYFTIPARGDYLVFVGRVNTVYERRVQMRVQLYDSSDTLLATHFVNDTVEAFTETGYLPLYDVAPGTRVRVRANTTGGTTELLNFATGQTFVGFKIIFLGESIEV